MWISKTSMSSPKVVRLSKSFLSPVYPFDLKVSSPLAGLAQLKPLLEGISGRDVPVAKVVEHARPGEGLNADDVLGDELRVDAPDERDRHPAELGRLLGHDLSK